MIQTLVIMGNIKNQFVKFCFLPAKKGLAKATGAAIHLGNHIEEAERLVKEGLKNKLEVNPEQPRNAIVENNLEIFKKLQKNEIQLNKRKKK